MLPLRALAVVVVLAPMAAAADDMKTRFESAFGESGGGSVKAGTANVAVSPPIPKPRPKNEASAATPEATPVSAPQSAEPLPAATTAEGAPAGGLPALLHAYLEHCCKSGTYRLGTFDLVRRGAGGNPVLTKDGMIIYRALEATGLLRVVEVRPSASVEIAATELAVSNGLVRDGAIVLPYARYSGYKVVSDEPANKAGDRRRVVQFTFTAEPGQFYVAFVKHLSTLRGRRGDSYESQRQGRALLELDPLRKSWRVVALDQENVGAEFTTAFVPGALNRP